MDFPLVSCGLGVAAGDGGIARLLFFSLLLSSGFSFSTLIVVPTGDTLSEVEVDSCAMVAAAVSFAEAAAARAWASEPFLDGGGVILGEGPPKPNHGQKEPAGAGTGDAGAALLLDAAPAVVVTLRPAALLLWAVDTDRSLARNLLDPAPYLTSWEGSCVTSAFRNSTVRECIANNASCTRINTPVSICHCTAAGSFLGADGAASGGTCDWLRLRGRFGDSAPYFPLVLELFLFFVAFESAYVPAALFSCMDSSEKSG
mmetsp:Transcript_15435/g.27204  ORF Transcript_15435/g.27204 Transcript_15435/m.27204 type:complete len:258 (+) Transcript_15435:221-994(+)